MSYGGSEQRANTKAATTTARTAAAISTPGTQAAPAKAERKLETTVPLVHGGVTSTIVNALGRRIKVLLTNEELTNSYERLHVKLPSIQPLRPHDQGFLGSSRSTNPLPKAGHRAA